MAVSDLTGTTWLINSSPTISPLANTDEEYSAAFEINFTFEEEYEGQLSGTELDISNVNDFLEGIYLLITYVASSQYLAYNQYGWDQENFRIITITGGTDATNSDLIAWLEANAVQQVQPSSSGSIGFGTLDISKMYWGDAEVSKVYYGDTLIYEAGEEPEPTGIPTKIVVEVANDGDTVYLPTDSTTNITAITWGDGDTTIASSHTYATAGIYTIYVYGMTKLLCKYDYAEIECSNDVVDYEFDSQGTINRQIIIPLLKVGDTINSWVNHNEPDQGVYDEYGLNYNQITNYVITGNGYYVRSKSNPYAVLIRYYLTDVNITLNNNIKCIANVGTSSCRLVFNTNITNFITANDDALYLNIDVPTIEWWHNYGRIGISKVSSVYLNGQSSYAIQIPSSITTLYTDEFNNWNGATSISGDSVITIQNKFIRSSSLTSISFINATSIGALSNDENLVPDNASYVPALTTINLPSITEIPSYFACYCTNLTTVQGLNNSALSIGNHAFMGNIYAVGISGLANVHIEAATSIYAPVAVSPTKVYLGINLATVSMEEPNMMSGNKTMIYYFDHTSSSSVLFTPADLFVKGSNKGTYTYNIYTDNATIKDGALAQVDQYTIVNVYKLNGGSW